MINFSKNKFFIFSSFLYLFLPISIVIGNFPMNFLNVYSFIFIIYFYFNIKNIKSNINTEVLYLTIFFLYLLINALVNNDEYTITATIKYLRFYFFCLCVFYLLNNSGKFYKQLIFIFFTVFIIVLIDGFFQYLFGVNLLGFKQEITHRVSGLFGNELILGSFISKYLAFVILLLLIKEKYKPFIFPILLFVLLLSFVSGERTAFATTVLISFFTICKLFNLKKVLLFISVTVTCIVAIVNLDGVVKNRMVLNTLENTKFLTAWKNPKSLKIYTDQHNGHFQSSYLMYKKGNFIEQLFGRGIKSFRNNCKKKEFCDTINCCSTHPHNIFLQILSEIGLIGLFFYLYFMLYLFYNSFQLFIKNKEDIKFIIIISIFCNYLPFLTSGNIFGTFMSTNFFLLVSFLIYFNNTKKNIT